MNEQKEERYQSADQNEQRGTVQQKDKKTKRRVSERDQVFVFVLSCQGYLRYTFPLISALWYYLTVNDNNKVYKSLQQSVQITPEEQ